MTRRPRLPATLLAFALVALVAACGGDDDDGAPSSTARETATEAVTIEHAMGSTTFEERPERILSLNVQWTDAVLALGEEPIAYVLDAASLETDPYPWQAEALADVERIDINGTIPYEQLAALRPDLILVTWLAVDQNVYDTLAEIAPTIGMLGDLDVDPWQDQVEVLGQVLGEEERAADVIAEVEGEVTAAGEELPGLAGKTYVAANYVPGDGIYVIADPDDGASELFYRLGMQIDPGILALDAQAVGRVQISLEQAGLLDADFIGILTNGGNAADLPGWSQLSAVQRGTVIDFEFADVVGLNTPTPLSVPYVLDLMRPTLEVLAAA